MARGRPRKGEAFFNPFEQTPEDRILEPEDQDLVKQEIANEVMAELVFDEPEEEVIEDISPAMNDEWAPILEAPKDGTRILVTDGNDEIKAFCRLTRRFFNFRWVPSPSWFDAATNMKIHFSPTHWKSV